MKTSSSHVSRDSLALGFWIIDVLWGHSLLLNLVREGNLWMNFHVGTEVGLTTKHGRCNEPHKKGVVHRSTLKISATTNHVLTDAVQTRSRQITHRPCACAELQQDHRSLSLDMGEIYAGPILISTSNHGPFTSAWVSLSLSAQVMAEFKSRECGRTVSIVCYQPAVQDRSC